jgi:hypothetical protein
MTVKCTNIFYSYERPHRYTQSGIFWYENILGSWQLCLYGKKTFSLNEVSVSSYTLHLYKCWFVVATS